jgi:hypothetical protein
MGKAFERFYRRPREYPTPENDHEAIMQTRDIVIGMEHSLDQFYAVQREQGSRIRRLEIAVATISGGIVVLGYLVMNSRLESGSL